MPEDVELVINSATAVKGTTTEQAVGNERCQSARCQGHSFNVPRTMITRRANVQPTHIQMQN